MRNLRTPGNTPATDHDAVRLAFHFGTMSTIVVAQDYDLDSRCLSLLAEDGLFSPSEIDELVVALRRVLDKRWEIPA